MREGWKYMLLKNACKVFTDGNWIESKDQSIEGIRLVQTGNIGFGYFRNKEDKARYISNETFERLKCTEILPGDLLVSRLPDPVGKSCIIPDLDTKMITGVDCTIIRPKESLLSEYLGYFQMSNQYLRDVQSRVSGTTRSRISRKNLGLIEIPIPPLPEQLQIVSILDRAFTAIDRAKANISTNIENAKELFQSKLNAVFSQKGEGWEEKAFGEVFKLKSGDGLTAKNMIVGKFPVFGGNGIAGYHNEFNLKGPEVIIGRVGALCGNVRLVDEKFWLTDNAFRVSEMASDFDMEFIVFMLNHKNLRSFARQAAQPVISNSSLKGIFLNYPTKKDEQVIIREMLKKVESKTTSLVKSYKEKLLFLEELKKSILQKAFAGELTSTGSVAHKKEVKV